MPKKDDVDVEKVVEEAKAEYSIEARLAGRPMREEKITLYTDEPAGNELGYAKDVDVRSILGVKTGTEREREGVLGEIDALEALTAGAPTPEQTKALKALHKKADSLRARLKGTAIKLELRAVPEIIKDSYQRQVKKELGFKGKGVPEAMEADASALSMAFLLKDTVTRYEDVREAVVLDKITLAGAKAMKSYLPPSEYTRLDMLLGKLQFKASIDSSAVDQADF